MQKENIARLSIRYKRPTGIKSVLKSYPVNGKISDFDKSPAYHRFASSVAMYGMLLRGSEHVDDIDLDDVLKIAQKSLGTDSFGYKKKFVEMVDDTKMIGVIAKN